MMTHQPEGSAYRTAPPPPTCKGKDNQSKQQRGNIDKGNPSVRTTSTITKRSLVGCCFALILLIWTRSVSYDLSSYLPSVPLPFSTQTVRASKPNISSGKKGADGTDSDSSNDDKAFPGGKHDVEGAYSQDNDGNHNFGLIDAYMKCCLEDNNINCTESDTKWFARLLEKSPLVRQGKATLYWAHMRKAGGTSFGNSIESAVFNHTYMKSALFTNGFVRTVKMHLWAASKDCVDHKYANETLFVTILRHPIDRYVSEYFYSKVWIDMKAKNDVKEILMEWYGRSLEGKEVIMSESRTQFIENWQTRWYTNPGPCDDLNRPPPHDSHPNYSYWRSGIATDPRKNIRREDLDTAKSVLEKFDIVGIAPFFNNGKECDIVPWVVLAGSNKPNETMDQQLNKNYNPSIEIVKYLRSNVTKYLYDQVKYDIELFEFAKQLSMRRSNIACCVQELMQQHEPKII